ncbi:unnamed protein product [Brassica oleracea var. botrytis]|uniref:(rape) hypothetical protein n=1 Tax=Brassica napus TaxID=3708 RepID=A0A816PZA9_BRANA|nr:unnamed protein product [Brassica napus]
MCVGSIEIIGFLLNKILRVYVQEDFFDMLKPLVII